MSSSLSVIPSRGRCIQATDYTPQCQCEWFTEPTSPLLNQTPLTQRCTCSVHLADHRPILNLHRFQDPFYVLDLLTTSIGVQSDGPHLGVDNAPYIPSTSASGTLVPPDDATNITFSQTHMPSPSTSQSSATHTTQSSDHHEFIFRHYIPRG
ncbi:hypothetical protein ARMGADRAFT_1010033 [Armillaria gallica]|uniref:Uncharacterized protein n=1 Tax=Armillaria gallica TaxID=47427 RepID=A0A2H3E712_ARMGA|nr:hypothetical protein ARMGADRAFT_1010033 [Armillaria gallica]